MRAGVGGITESDVNLAAASDAVVLGFNVRPVGEARQLADREGVEIRTYSVIYRAIDELRDAMQGMLAPEEVEETRRHTSRSGQIFRASKVGTIAGCMVTDGKVTRGAKVRLVRDGAVVYDGEIASLRRFNDDVREVLAGFECGIVLANFADVKEGDRSRSTRRGRSSARSPSSWCERRRSSCSCASTCIFPESGSLKAQASRAQPRQGAPARAPAARPWRRSPTRTRGSARRSRWRSRPARRAAARRRPTRSARYLDAASRRACGSSAGSRHGATWSH